MARTVESHAENGFREIQPEIGKTEGASPLGDVLSVGLMALIAVVFFAKPLFISGQVISLEHTDIYREFLFSRSFGFGELRQGNLALWNPHIYSGMPYLASFQSALLYPLNWLYLMLPINQAINWGIVFHLILGGTFMHLWARSHNLHPLAGFTAGTLFMFCGAHYLHVMAGHLSNVCTLVWAPLLFLAVEKMAYRLAPGWLMVGMAAVAMQILAGNPQYVFYTGVTAGLYGVLLGIRRKRPSLPLWVVTMGLGGALLAAIQLLPGTVAGAESIRGKNLPFEFVAMFSFPPENFITLIWPCFFGDALRSPYWGGGTVWEMAPYIGVTGFVLAVRGAFKADNDFRFVWLVMVGVLFLLALGRYTPLLHLLYSYCPGFDNFRGVSKFMLFGSFFIIILAAHGSDLFLREAKGYRRRWFITGGLILAAIMAGGGLWIQQSWVAGNLKGLWLQNIFRPMEESCLPLQAFRDPWMITASGRAAALTLYSSAGFLLVLTVAVWVANRRVRGRGVVAVVVLAEILFWSSRFKVDFDPAALAPPVLERVFQLEKMDGRLLNQVMPNQAMVTGSSDIWGADPGIPRRYAEFMAVSQNKDSDSVTQDLHIRQVSPLLNLLRLKKVVYGQKKGEIRVVEVPFGNLPRMWLVTAYDIQPNRRQLLRRLAHPGFDPRKTVLLEEIPNPFPDAGEPSGKVQVVRETTDSIEIKAQLARPAILVLSEGFAPGWRVQPLESSLQSEYQVLAANYVLRGIPLAKGNHHFILEYRPRAFVLGCWISGAAWVTFGFFAGWLWYRKVLSKKNTKYPECPQESCFEMA